MKEITMCWLISPSEVQLDEDTGLSIARDKYIWNRDVYGDHTFVREMHEIATNGDLSQGETLFKRIH